MSALSLNKGSDLKKKKKKKKNYIHAPDNA